MNRTIVRVVALSSLLWGMLPTARAQGGGGNTGGGTIYFRVYQTTYTMNSDGSGKAPLPAGVEGVPSRLLHGGHRWFLTVGTIPGETYPSANPNNTRREMFAVRDDGNPAFTVQLTTQADLEANWTVRWRPGDAQVTWTARLWSSGQVVGGGIYSADILFDGSGNVIGLAAQPSAPLVSLQLVPWPSNLGGLWAGDLAPDIADILGFDWSPTGTQIVFDRFSAEQLWIADLPSGTATLLIAPVFANTPAWSPDGSKIAFTGNLGGAFGGICSVQSNGTGPKLLVKSGTTYSVGAPRWSPTGSHFVYERWSSFNQPPPAFVDIDVYRASASGKGLTNLTADLTAQVASPVEWR